MKRFLIGVVVGIVLAVGAPLAAVWAGLVDVGATGAPGRVESLVAEWAMERSVANRAPRALNPRARDPQALADGAMAYSAMCVECHGGPGVRAEDWARGLNPPAPALEEEQLEFTDGELFWIVKHGIRMTGMPAFAPTHDDAQVWGIVAFLRELPRIAAERGPTPPTSAAAPAPAASVAPGDGAAPPGAAASPDPGTATPAPAALVTPTAPPASDAAPSGEPAPATAPGEDAAPPAAAPVGSPAGTAGTGG